MTNPDFVSLHDCIRSIQESDDAISPGAQWVSIRDHFDNAIESAIRSISNGHTIQPENGANTLKVVHYTSLANIVQILKEAQKPRQKGHLRMYSSAGFNDPDEGRYLFSQSDPFAFPDLRQEQNSVNPEPAYAYIASFIKPDNQDEVPRAADNLVFWRSYGHDGRGCSLTLTIDPTILRKIEYGRDIAEVTWKHLSEGISSAYQAVKHLDNQVANKELDNWLGNKLMVAVQAIAYLYKSDAYQYENECRIVRGQNDAASQSPKIEFVGHPDNGATTRYIEIPELSTDPSDGMFRSGSVITLGPQVVNPEHTQADLRELIRNARIYTKVQMSTIKYRGRASRQ